MKSVLKLFAFILFPFLITAQEKISTLPTNSRLLYQKNNTTSNSGLAVQKRQALNLPFFDDFSLKNIYPQVSLWTDSFVYINDHLQNPNVALSYGVATFDGLNKLGRPYNTTTPTAYGTADTLTSQPIDLSVYQQDDTSIYLSFWYAPQGLGDWPNEDDSLILEGKTLNAWKILWATGGFETPPGETPFKRVNIQINDPFFFVSDFQFRFRNLATSGNNDHWHVDYVYLDAGRASFDTINRDISVINIPTNILRNYTAMPWNQFVDNQAEETDSVFFINFRNNDGADRNLPFNYEIRELFTNTFIDNDALSFSPFIPSTYFNKEYNTNSFTPFSFSEDSVLLRLTQFCDVLGFDRSITNDTSWVDIPFYNYFAYDDGSAELAYGLEGPGLKKFAYEFNLNKPDTLRAIQIHFSYIKENVEDLLFTFFVWDNINFETKQEDTLYQEDFIKAAYFDSINSFATFILEQPVALQNGSFYLGWQQVDDRNLQIGLDASNSAKDKIHVFANGSWFASSTEAAPMIRPVVGKAVAYKNVVSASNISMQNALKIYPNPANEYVMLESKNNDKQTVYITDITGKLLYTTTLQNNSSQLDISNLPAGTYFIKTLAANGTYYPTQKLVKMN